MAQALQLPSFGITFPSRREEYNRRQWSPVKSLQSPTWLKEVYDRISALSTLEENWDSHGGLPAIPEAILKVRVLLSNLNIENVPRPHVAASPDGSVGLHWRVAERDLEIEVEASGAIHYLKTLVGREPIEGSTTMENAQGVLDWIIGR